MKRLMLAIALLAAPAAAEDAELETLVPGESGTVLLAYDVAPSGHVENCTVERSSGFARLDAASCRMMALSTRYAPSAERTRMSKAIRWSDNGNRPRASSIAPHPFGEGEGTPDDWAALNPQWGSN